MISHLLQNVHFTLNTGIHSQQNLNLTPSQIVRSLKL